MSASTPIDTSATTFTAFPPPNPPLVSSSSPSPSPGDDDDATSATNAAAAAAAVAPNLPLGSVEAVLKPSDPIPDDWKTVRGIEFNDFRGRDVTVPELLASMERIGFQGSNLSRGAATINRMRGWRGPAGEKATIFLGYTSNLISSGLRETLRFLVEHRHVDAVVTTAGGIEEDLIKCLAPTYMGAFSLDGAGLRARGLNRIGNLLVPNANYCAFEDWIIPIFDAMLAEQEAGAGTEGGGTTWTPSSIIRRLGKEIDDPRSVCYWAYRNDIPVFCPALTDGSIGDMLHFHTFRSAPAQLRCDIVADVRRINTMAVRAAKSGVVVLGGGLVKHHIANANLMRNGAEWAVFVNTASEYDGSDAGARPDEAVSWGKIKADGESVKVYCEATIAFPMLVAATWGSTGGMPKMEGGEGEA